MSTQISSVLQESYEIFHRIFFLLDDPQFDTSSLHSQDKLGSRQIDKTFEESVVKSKYPRMNEIALRIEKWIVEHIKSENQQIEKYEEQLQFLQAKLRKQTKNEIENQLLIETLEQENNDLRKQILTLKDELIDKQKALQGTQLKMTTQIKTLQSQISSLRRLDNLISDNFCGFEDPEEKAKTTNQQLKKKNQISQIKNRLSFCEVNDFYANLFETLTPNTLKNNNKTAEYDNKISKKKDQKRSQNTVSIRSSYSSLSRKQPTSRQPQMKECQKTTKNDVKKNKKNLKIKEVEPVALKSQKKPLGRRSSKLKVKK